MKARILPPLGMAATRTSLREAWKRSTRGSRLRVGRGPEEIPAGDDETLGNNIDGIAPAGAISSTALDMTSWIRFLLRQGVHDGKALISPAALTTTWTPQIQVGGTRLRLGMVRAQLAGAAADRARQRDRGIQRGGRSAS